MRSRSIGSANGLWRLAHWRVLAALGLGLGLGLVCGCTGVATAARQSGFSLAAYDSLCTWREGSAPAGGASTVEISAALGETEGFQIILANASAETLRDLRVSVSGLAGVEVTIYAVGSVRIGTPGRSTEALPGRYYDLLRPAGWESVAPGQFQPYWIDLRVPDRGVAPGRYRGAVSVASGSGLRQLPVSLRVREFHLPVTPTLKVAFAFGLSWMEQYYGQKLTPDQFRAAQDPMLDHRLGPVPMWDSGKEFFNEETVKHCLGRGMNVFLLSCGGQTDDEIGRSLEALQPKVALLRALDALDRTYLFGYDEILATRPERVPSMRKAYEGFQTRYPGIKRINTSRPDARLRDFVDIFVVPTNECTPDLARERETWWYSVGADRLSTEPDFRIDFPGAVQRGFFSADWAEGVTGHLYWAVQREWPNNQGIQDKSRPESEWQTAYANAFTQKLSEDNGGGNLFYPDGAGGMLPTPRVKRIRDGIEDYEYLAQLQARVAELEGLRPPGWKSVAKRARALLTVPATVVEASSGAFPGWTVAGSDAPFSITVHPNALHGGQQALRVVPGGQEAAVYQDLPITPGKPCTVSGWVKTDDLTGQACIRAEFRDAQGAVLLRCESDPVSGSTGPKTFIQGQVAVPTAPPGTVSLRLSLVACLTSVPTGKDVPLPKAFFDDISVRRGRRDEPLSNPGFEVKRLWITRDAAPLLAYRERLGDSLDECAEVLGRATAPAD